MGGHGDSCGSISVHKRGTFEGDVVTHVGPYPSIRGALLWGDVVTHVGPYPSIRGALLWGDMVTHVGPYPSIKGARLRGDVVTHMSISVHKRGTFAGNRRHLKFGMWFVSDS